MKSLPIANFRFVQSDEHAEKRLAIGNRKSAIRLWEKFPQN